MATKLVYLTKDGSEPLTDTSVIAKALDYDHHNVIQLTRKYQNDLEQFGPVAFEMQPGKDSHGWGGDRQIALLNEQQATLLICYMRNSEKVRTFKLKLVKAFYEMKKYLQEQRDHTIAYIQGWEDARNHYLEKVGSKMGEYALVPKECIDDLKICYERGEKLRPEIRELMNLLRKLTGEGTYSNIYVIAVCNLLNNFSAEKQAFLSGIKTPDIEDLFTGRPAENLQI